MAILGVLWKVVMIVGGLVGVAAQAKARGATNAETIAETAAALVTGAGALQMRPLAMKKKS